MKSFTCKIEGITPLLQHRMPEDVLFGLLGAKTERKKDKEIRTPRELAKRYAYLNKDGSSYIPSAYISGAIASVSGDYKQKHSIRKSLKYIISGVFRPVDEHIQLKSKDHKPLKKFEVDIRRGNNFQRGAVAVCRPRFDKWYAEFEVQIDDSLVASETCLHMLQDAGKRAGIGSFRVQKGGYFGQFIVTHWKESKK